MAKNTGSKVAKSASKVLRTSTSKTVKSAKAVSKVLRDGRTSKAAKSVAGSALSQAKGHTTSSTVAKKTSTLLRDGRVSSKTKTAAASSLSQLRNPRSGHFVKIDRTSGSIISHKKSRGAYKSIPIAKKSSSLK